MARLGSRRLSAAEDPGSGAWGNQGKEGPAGSERLLGCWHAAIRTAGPAGRNHRSALVQHIAPGAAEKPFCDEARRINAGAPARYDRRYHPAAMPSVRGSDAAAQPRASFMTAW